MKEVSQKSVFVTTNGCNRRLLDAARLIAYFQINGYGIAESSNKADFIFLFASSLNRVRVEESFRLIENLSKQQGELIILGCLPAAAPTLFNKRFKGKALTIRDINQIDSFFPEFQVPYQDIPVQNTPLSKKLLYKGIWFKILLHRMRLYLTSPQLIKDRVYAIINKEKEESNKACFIWVSHGCPNKCAFCSERKAVGDLVSRPVESIKIEYKQLIDQGKREFEFIGDDVGSWGIDINSTLPVLLKELSGMDKGLKTRWIIKHLHPKFLIKYKTDLMEYAKNGKISEIICSFQSGSNRVLELMNRNHTIEEVIETIGDFRAVNPQLKYATNVIAGFPTETDEEFDKTLEVLKLLNFDRIHLIKYFNAEGTDSYTLEPKIDDKIINERIRRAKIFLKQHNLFYQSRD
jgi:tRNA A37 methylthiotransferase MiaB